jgi:hypothetical protein
MIETTYEESAYTTIVDKNIFSEEIKKKVEQIEQVRKDVKFTHRIF